MTNPASYSIESYGHMILSEPRMGAYARALQSAVKPGCVVVDIGAGTGIFSLLAARYGAGHIHAIEPDASIEVAREMAHANGVADKITFHRQLSTQVHLDRKADVIVSDLRGVIPVFQHHIATIVDARSRLLAAGGALIPLRDTIYACPVEDESLYAGNDKPWQSNAYDLDLREGRKYVIQNWTKAQFDNSALRAAPQTLATLDYATIAEPNIVSRMRWPIARRCTLHGIGVWFDADLGFGEQFSNAPSQPLLIYQRAFFPLEKALAVEPGDELQVEMQAWLVDNEYVWRWKSSLVAADGTARATYDQSTLLAAPLSLESLRRMDSKFAPEASSSTEVLQHLLTVFDGKATLEEMARALAARFPARFARWHDALGYVQDTVGWLKSREN